MNELIVIVTMFACGLTLIVSPWVEKKLDDYHFKRKLKRFGVESTGNRYLDRFHLLHTDAYYGHFSDDDYDYLVFLSSLFSYSSVDDYYG